MRTTLPALLLALTACGALPQSGLAAAQQSAQEFNMDSRFGRTAMVLQKIAPAARDQYATQHRAWGTEIHIADVELAGMKAKDDHEVKVFVRVSWYRTDQQELRATTLEQTWRGKLTPDWELVAEKRIDGDIGLLGEAIVYAAPDPPKRPVQFPTIRLGEAAGAD